MVSENRKQNFIILNLQINSVKIVARTNFETSLQLQNYHINYIPR